MLQIYLNFMMCQLKEFCKFILFNIQIYMQLNLKEFSFKETFNEC